MNLPYLLLGTGVTLKNITPKNILIILYQQNEEYKIIICLIVITQIYLKDLLLLRKSYRVSRILPHHCPRIFSETKQKFQATPSS